MGKRTKGKVVVQFFPGQTLTKAKQMYDGVVQGMSDLGFCLFGYNRGRFPLMEVVDLPLGYKTGKAATKVANAVYQKFQPKELDDVQVMYLNAHGPGILFTKWQGGQEDGGYEGPQDPLPRHHRQGGKGPGRHPGGHAHARALPGPAARRG